MSEQYEYSKAKHKREVLDPAMRKTRREFAFSLMFVVILIAMYTTKSILHWW